MQTGGSGTTKKESKPPKKEGGFFDKILSLFTGLGDPDRDKKKLLRDLGKDLKKHKEKFYNVRTEEALPGLANFFYELYKLLGPVQVFVDRVESSAVLKNILIENSFTDQQKALKEELSEDRIRVRAQNADTKALAGELKDQFVTFFSAFDSKKVKEIEDLNDLLVLFLQLANFDYYFFLKKFDSNLPERDFFYNPRFDTIKGEYVVDDLKDFLELLPLIERDAPWDKLFNVLKEYRGSDMVSPQLWKKGLKNLLDVQKSEIFQKIVRHLEKDPYYKPLLNYQKSKIVEEYLTKIKTQTEMTIQKILQERKSNKIDSLAKTIFGTTSVSRMKYYTDKANLNFSKKMLGGYTHLVPINYLKAFLIDYFKKDIREVVDILIIRGKWSATVFSQQLSEAFHGLLQCSEELIKFDESLSEEGPRGIALKNALTRMDRDKSNLKYVKQQLKEINDNALKLIYDAAGHLITLGKSLKVVLEDYGKKPHELLSNWKELNSAANNEIKEKIMEIYKKIYYFIQLLQYFLKT